MSGSEESRVQWRPDVRELVQRLQPALDRVEEHRQGILQRRSNGMLIAVICVVAGIAAALAVGAAGDGRTGLPALILLFLGIGAAILVYYRMAMGPMDAYRNYFKSTVFRHALAVVAPGVEYHPERGISQDLFERSELFDSRIDSYEGEDCFHGKVGATRITLSELHVQRKEQSNKSTHWVTVFQGIFMIVDFHKHFRSVVTIEPDIAEAAFGFLGRGLQNLTGNVIRLENPEFERAFKVCGNDPVEARYLLTPDMQERFLKLRNNWSTELRAVFRESWLVLAIPKQSDWFEVDIHLPANSPEHLRRFFSELLPLLHIPTQLDLDTRIWTKE